MAVDTEEIENNDSGSPNPTAGLLGGGSQSYNPELASALSEIKATGKENPVTVDDFKSDNDRPATGALSNETYYPGMNLPTRVGNYSGSMVGSIDLFAPTGNLVPIGMSDARDLAVKKAAMQKQLENEKFLKDHQRPITKDTQIQPQLTKQYNDYIATSLASAKKKYGKNAIAFLNQDPDFQNGLNNLQDLAKHYDAVIDHEMELDKAEKDPNFVMSPELRQLRNERHDKIRAMDNNPADPRALGLGNNILNSRATYDMDAVANDFLHSVKQNINEADLNESLKAGKKVGTEQFLDQIKRTYYDPEKLEPGMQNIYRDRYTGDPYAPTYEKFKQSALSKLNEHVEHQFKNYDTYHPPQEKKEDDYTNSTPQIGATFNSTVNTGEFDTQGNPTSVVKPVYTEQAHNTLAHDQQKKLSFVLNNKMRDLSGSGLENSSGNIEGNAQKAVVMPYDVANKRFYTPEEVSDLKAKGKYFNNHNLRFETGVIVNTTPKKDADGNTLGGSATSIVIPTDDAKGKISKGFDEIISKTEQKAAELNSKRHLPVSGPTTIYKIKGYDYSEEEIDSEAKKRGLTRNQLLTQLNYK